MKPYIDIADDIKVSAMDKFNQIRFLCSKKSEYFDFLEHIKRKTIRKSLTLIPHY